MLFHVVTLSGAASTLLPPPPLFPLFLIACSIDAPFRCDTGRRRQRSAEERERQILDALLAKTTVSAPLCVFKLFNISHTRVSFNSVPPPPFGRALHATQRSDGQHSDVSGVVHEQALLSTATLDDFEVLRSIAAGNNGQIFEVACTVPQVIAAAGSALACDG